MLVIGCLFLLKMLPTGSNFPVFKCRKLAFNENYAKNLRHYFVGLCDCDPLCPSRLLSLTIMVLQKKHNKYSTIFLSRSIINCRIILFFNLLFILFAPFLLLFIFLITLITIIKLCYSMPNWGGGFNYTLDRKPFFIIWLLHFFVSFESFWRLGRRYLLVDIISIYVGIMEYGYVQK